ncbi:phosphoenolpyruvate carboxylase [Caldimicrobium thiodismutans]|uniref:Phosphoenolpyruvate carboxylase n=1 Tax=Caldimicrobium thiodismutans TaxID=1653476 RepID=A0A0U5API1_9BACT|nr:phosphoenolpyruvate carboxylase [Caldimicrobium thiodismutans]BAU23826.1 phosphoenolpyruvate carboxylase [Caldimicrobium thiodismutans]
MRKIPRVMSTQHPDNVSLPFFAETPDMSGEDEIQEAYYAFSHLGCDEQMWDSEGKEVDDFVVKKLLTRYPHFFRKRRLGEEIFLTLRVPNPSVEKEEAKILVEALESIPRSMDAARLFYGEVPSPPIFEVILPMTTSAEELNRVYYFYKNFISGKQHQAIYPGSVTVAEWVGDFLPEKIQVIPLFEDVSYMLRADEILREYLKDKEESYLRVFLARSDPALNYGIVAAVLGNKIALKKVYSLSQELEKELFPILGAGSPPFRGNLSPYTVDYVLSEYSFVETFTVQSAFKYDNPIEDAITAIKRIKNFVRYPLEDFDEKLALQCIEKTSEEYQDIIEKIANLINLLSRYVPRRRMRKLHVGLFGYSRQLGKITLPRAIGFCSACYSIGLPPEIIGLSALTREELLRLKEIYKNMEIDLSLAMRYFNPKILEMIPEVKEKLLKALNLLNTLNLKVETDLDHREITSRIIKDLKRENYLGLTNLIIEAGLLRRFLG